MGEEDARKAAGALPASFPLRGPPRLRLVEIPETFLLLFLPFSSRLETRGRHWRCESTGWRGESEMTRDTDAEDFQLDAPIRSFSHRGWDVHIYLTRISPETYTGQVDIFDGDIKRCRIVLAGPLKEIMAISALESKSADWVDDWLSRPHTGSTGFSAL